jgi:hypothetical protein
LKIRGDIRNSRCTTGINDTGGKFATSINHTGGKFFHQLLILVANLPPVSFTPVGNNGRNYQTADNLKNYVYANSTTQRCPKEIIKIFLIEVFFH